MRIYLDGNLIPLENHSDLYESSITYNLESGQINDQAVPNNFTRSFSSNITFYNETATYIENKLACNNPFGKEKIRVVIIDDCCGADAVIFQGKITYQEIDKCYIKDGAKDCTIECKVIEDTDIQGKYDCIRTALIRRDSIVKNTRFDDIKHPAFIYCRSIRPLFMDGFYKALFAALMSITVGLMLPMYYLIIGPISLLISAVNAISSLLGLGYVIDFNGSAPGAGSLLGYIEDSLQDTALARFLTGCGKRLLSPRVEDMILAYCAQCGLAFKSSIFRDPNSRYYNTTHAFSVVELPGSNIYTDNTGASYINEIRDEYWKTNFYNETGLVFINKIARVFNAYWDIRDENGVATLVFEKKNYRQITWMDTQTINEKNIINFCFQWKNERLPAMTEFKWTDDSTEVLGTEARHHYDDLVDWKLPRWGYNGKDLVGLKEFMFPYSRARFNKDGITLDMNDWLYNTSYQTSGRWYNMLIGFNPLMLTFTTLMNLNPFYGGIEDDFDGALYLGMGIATTPKLLIYDPETPIGAAKAIRLDKNDPRFPFERDYNFWMWISDDYQYQDPNGNVIYKPHRSPNLFEEFWQSENPNLYNRLGVDFTLELVADCALVLEFRRLLDLHGNNLNIVVPYCGTSYTSYKLKTVLISNNKMTITGEI